ncbi:unnamed protein product [Durusdinium trenchii]|uniref:Uncharacterized protein n=1 Tax=Durusdinium trenchii TaxID=1381693 RepID=A0ABP0PB94_9DINO
MASGSIPQEVLAPVLESLGTSLAHVLPCCQSLASAALQGDAAAFQPLARCRSMPSPGHVGSDFEWGRCGRVARARRPKCDWRDIAKAMTVADRGQWSEVPTAGAVPSQRQSLALCGATARSEKVILFGGNTSRRVAGSWEPSRTLCLVDLPNEHGSSVHFTSIDTKEPWPTARWGSTLTQTTTGALLWGGWSRHGNSQPWMLRFREACPDWTELPNTTGPWATAFHTATGLEDGKRVAIVGGLGDGSSHDGVWTFHADTGRWTHCSGGPAPAGHVAALDADGQRLLLSFGVRRSPDSLNGDSFLETMNVFDLRMNRWDDLWKDKVQVNKPCARRNPAGASIGRYFIISGGYSEEDFSTLNDTWAFDMRRGTWKLLDLNHAPPVEGHKAIASGLDLFTFGGHRLRHFEGPHVSVHKLALCQGPDGEGPGPTSSLCSKLFDDGHSDGSLITDMSSSGESG